MPFDVIYIDSLVLHIKVNNSLINETFINRIMVTKCEGAKKKQNKAKFL